MWPVSFVFWGGHFPSMAHRQHNFSSAARTGRRRLYDSTSRIAKHLWCDCPLAARSCSAILEHSIARWRRSTSMRLTIAIALALGIFIGSAVEGAAQSMPAGHRSSAWDGFQVIMWQEKTLAQYGTLAKLGVTADRKSV